MKKQGLFPKLSDENNGYPLERMDLATLYHRYGYIVLRICKEILGDSHDAQDAFQDTFLKFERHLTRYPTPHEALAGLRKTALSCSIDLLRRRQRHEENHPPALWDLLPDTPVEEAFRRYDDRQIATLLLRQVRADQDTLTMAYLYYLDEMTLEEVASSTGYSRRSVQMKLERFCDLARKFCTRHGILW